MVRSGADKGIVRRHRVGADMHRRMRIRRQAAGTFVHVDAQELGVEAFVDEACVVEGVVPSAAIADADVEKAIRSEVHITAVVVASGIELREERLLHAVVEA